MRFSLISEWSILLFIAVCNAGTKTSSIPYDYSASNECLEVPYKPQYGGGMIYNPEFDDGLKGWTIFTGGIAEQKISNGGNRYAMTRGRSQTYHSISQKLYLEKDKLYTFSAWLQVNEGSVPITAVFKTSSGFTIAGTAFAQAGCWSMLKGGLTVKSSGPAEIYFETEDTTKEVWVDSVSLQPFTEEQWRNHQKESIHKVRKRRVALNVSDIQGNALLGGSLITIRQQKRGFPFGAVTAQEILTSPAYQSWFTSRFTVTTFANEMKWYSTERSRGSEDYSVPDKMLAFAQSNGVEVRAHNVLWDDGNYQPSWVPALPPAELQAAVNERIDSFMTRYKGKVIGWDVVNENRHFSFLESKLGAGASAAIYQRARQIDPSKPMFVNEYNTIEEPEDRQASPSNLLQKVKQVGASAFGLEGHFRTPNIPYMRSAIDTLAQAGLPIWITEVDVTPSPDQAHFLEQILREAYAHPAVCGIVLWPGPAYDPNGCNTMCLTDGAFKNLPTGDVVDGLIKEWGTHSLVGTADGRGIFEAELFHGEYEVTVSRPSRNSSSTHSLTVAAGSSPEETLHVEL